MPSQPGRQPNASAAAKSQTSSVTRLARSAEAWEKDASIPEPRAFFQWMAARPDRVRDRTGTRISAGWGVTALHSAVYSSR